MSARYWHACVLAAALSGCAASAPVRQTGSPESARLAALGRAYLNLGDLDGAVESLGGAAALAPRDAGQQVDLARALLDRAEQRPFSSDSLAAVDAAETALDLEPGRKDALAALARGLKRLGLPLAIDPEGWRDGQRVRFREALQRGDESVAQELVARDPTGFRDWLERDLLPSWAEAQMAADASAELSSLSLASAAAAHLTRGTGDPLLEETVAGIQRARDARDPSRLTALAQGLRSYREGRSQVEAFDMDAAGRTMDRARAVLDSAQSPLALSAEFYLAVRDYYAQDRKAASDRLLGLIDRADGRGYRLLSAHARRVLGLIDAVESRLSSALARYQEALATYRAAGETDAALYALTLIAECHSLLGDPREEWRIRSEMLPLVSGMHDRRAVTQILLDAADNALRLGHPRAALRIQDAAIEVNGEHDPEAQVWRARVELALGRGRDAARDLSRAERENGRGTDEAVAARLGAEILLVQAAALVDDNPLRAMTLLTRAGAFFESAGLEARLPELHLQRASAALALGQDGEAERQLLQGIEAYERNRPAIEEGFSRVSYFDRSGEIFDAMVAFQLDRREDPDAAFRFAERGRARTLADRQAAVEAAAAPAAIARRLPAGTLVLDYLVLPQRLVAWALDAGGVRRVEHDVSASELARLAAALADPIDEVGADHAAGALEGLLLDPFSQEIARATTVLFVPDKDLHRVPFARLRVSRAYLVEKAAIVSLPRADLAVARRGRPASPSQVPCRVLVAGDPSLDASTRNLSILPGARLEARSVALTWPGAELLLGGAATKARFLEQMSETDLVHFAGHAVVREERPASSFLALAPDPVKGDTGALQAREIEGLRLPRAPLIVLSGCETGGGPLSRSEGALSLARPFLAAGASQVVASLWPIDDASSSRFFAEFHRRLREGLCPVAALRATQLAFLHHSDPDLRTPRAWAAFTIFGPAENQNWEGGSPCPFHSSCSSADSVSSRSRSVHSTARTPTTCSARRSPSSTARKSGRRSCSFSKRRRPIRPITAGRSTSTCPGSRWTCASPRRTSHPTRSSWPPRWTRRSRTEKASWSSASGI